MIHSVKSLTQTHCVIWLIWFCSIFLQLPPSSPWVKNCWVMLAVAVQHFAESQRADRRRCSLSRLYKKGGSWFQQLLEKTIVLSPVWQLRYECCQQSEMIVCQCVTSTYQSPTSPSTLPDLDGKCHEFLLNLDNITTVLTRTCILKPHEAASSLQIQQN